MIVAIVASFFCFVVGRRNTLSTSGHYAYLARRMNVRKPVTRTLLALLMMQSLRPISNPAADMSDRMVQQTGVHCMAIDDKPDDRDNKVSSTPQQDLVITPAGPIPRDKVHEVRPGETVRQNKDGTMTIVPKPENK
jgi:hypothetical protein